MNDAKLISLAGGELTLWSEQPGSIMLKVNSNHSDPVELGESEVEELISALQALLKEIS